MPQKRPFTPSNIKLLEEKTHDSYSSLLLARSVLSGYFKASDEIMKDLEAITRLHKRFNSDLKENLKTKNEA